MLKDQVIKRGYEFARDYDSASSEKAGYIEKREFRMFLKYLYLRVSFEMIFHVIDDNEDQRISRSEFASLKSIFPRLGLAGIEFENLDADNNGFITLNEIIYN